MLEKYSFRIEEVLFRSYADAVEFKQSCEANGCGECEIKRFDGEKMMLDLTSFNFDLCNDRYFLEGVEEEIFSYGRVELKDIQGNPKVFDVNYY